MPERQADYDGLTAVVSVIEEVEKDVEAGIVDVKETEVDTEIVDKTEQFF